MQCVVNVFPGYNCKKNNSFFVVAGCVPAEIERCRWRALMGMNNHIRLEHINLLPWRRLGGREHGDEELGLDDDNLSESESHFHDYNNPRGSMYR